MIGPMERAHAAWGEVLPDWIEALALASAATSQARVAARIGRTGGVVSGVLARKYAGNMAAIEELVRGALMGAVVACPAVGEMPTHECALWRERARNFSGHNAWRVRMYRACVSCPRFTGEGEP